MSKLPLQEGNLHHRQQGSSCGEEFTSGDPWSLAKYGYTDQCIGCQHAKLEPKPADHSEECRARIIRQMSVDVDLSQRVQIAQQRKVDRAPPELQPPQKKVRFKDEVEEQTSEHHSTSSSSASIPQNPSSSSTTITTPNACR